MVWEHRLDQVGHGEALIYESGYRWYVVKVDRDRGLERHRSKTAYSLSWLLRQVRGGARAGPARGKLSKGKQVGDGRGSN